MRPVGDASAFVAGFVAAEGTFVSSSDRFRFAIALGATDAGMCEMAASVIGVGHLYSWPRRQEHFDDEATIVVQSLKDLVETVVPFMDAYLPASHKREQFLVWRTELRDYWENRAKRRRPCTIEGCDAPQRAKGICRRHYFARFRR